MKNRRLSSDNILIIDYGSQYNQLIARRIRELKVFSRIVPPDIPVEKILSMNPKGIIFSGGPSSVYEKNVPKPDPEIYSLGIPILGICYGMQLIAHQLNGAVKHAKKREYGRAEIRIDDSNDLFKGLPKKSTCWMSHGDSITRLPAGFKTLAHTKDTKIASFGNAPHKIFGVQFHPEVVHTQHGVKILKNFVSGICACRPSWTMKSFASKKISEIKERAEGNKVILGLSGGVDSSVAAVLINKAIGRKLTCIFVDNGLLRKEEGRLLKVIFKKHFKINLIYIEAARRFLNKLKGVTDPEKKRKIIGKEFIKVFEKEAHKLGKVGFLAQGTLYPDVIESRSAFGGPSATIKTHHNVGGLPDKMKLKLIEPLRELFKDEVRLLGKELGLPDSVVYRQPFPGPGLAVRILGEVTKERCDLLREVDAIVAEEIKKAGYYYKVWQSFSVLLPIKAVGVMGDMRTYENVVAIRAVTSQDGMTADWAKLPYDLLAKMSNRIINEVRGVNRVAYDISSKPPSTIEWE